jgi:nucleoside-diphosphate-sugar epimerase
MLHEYFTGSRTRFIWLRPFSIYGPKDSDQSLIPQMFKAAQMNARFELNNPGLAWSPLHISDFGRAVKEIVNADHYHGVINVGNPNPTSIYEFSRTAQELIQQIYPTWKGCEFGPQSSQNGKIPKVEKLHNLGWSPKFTLQAGVEDTVNWLNANPLTKVSTPG